MIQLSFTIGNNSKNIIRDGMISHISNSIREFMFKSCYYSTGTRIYFYTKVNSKIDDELNENRRRYLRGL